MSNLDDIPLPDSIPLPDDIPLPPLPIEEIPPPPEIPLPEDIPPPPADHDRSYSPPQDRRPAKKRKLEHDNGERESGPTCTIDEESEMMARIMGFSKFDSTKGKMVPGNNLIGSVHVVKKRRYRQYMNRKGGFNRPLDKVA